MGLFQSTVVQKQDLPSGVIHKGGGGGVVESGLLPWVGQGNSLGMTAEGAAKKDFPFSSLVEREV